MTGSLIDSEVDFDAPGNQTGFLRVPHSVHRSAYEWLPCPVVSIKGKLGGGGAVAPDILAATDTARGGMYAGV